MQFSKLVIAAFVALASSVTAAPIAVGGDLIEARAHQDAAQFVGNIAQFQADKNTGLVAVQLDPQTAASLFNIGVLKQTSFKRSHQDAVQAVGNIAQFQADKNTGLVAVQLDPQTALSLGNLGILKQFSGRDQTALQAVGNIAQFQHDTNKGGFIAIQEDPQTAISAGNVGVLKQFHWARDASQDATQAVGNIAQFQHDTNKGHFIAIQEDPQTAVSAGNVGVLKQFQGFWARGTTQNAGQAVGNIVQSQSNSNSGGLVAIQVDPQVAISLGNLGLLSQSSSGGGSTTQNAGQAVGNIAQTQHNTNKGGLVGIQADPQIAISGGNVGALSQSAKTKW